jgi:hypothetical protein
MKELESKTGKKVVSKLNAKNALEQTKLEQKNKKK